MLPLLLEELLLDEALELELFVDELLVDELLELEEEFGLLVPPPQAHRKASREIKRKSLIFISRARARTYVVVLGKLTHIQQKIITKLSHALK